MTIVDFFCDTRITGRETNLLVKKEMITGFEQLEDVSKINFHYIAGSRQESRETKKMLESDKINPRPLLIPFYSTKLAEKNQIYKIWKILLINRLIELLYIKRIYSSPKKSVLYLWGIQPAISYIATSYLLEREAIIELDDHIFKNRIRDKVFLKASKVANRVSTVSRKTFNDLVEKGIDREKVNLFPNGINLEEYLNDSTKQSLKRELNMASEKIYVSYTGHLYERKGVDTAIEAFKNLKDDKFELNMIGGNDEDISHYKNKVEKEDVENVNILGYISKDDVIKYQKASDILILPNSSEFEVSKYYTCPVKLREYMASGNPVIASDLPSVRKIVDNDAVFFFQSDKPESLMERIKYVTENPEEAQSKAGKAQKQSKKYTWESRASQLIEGL